MLPIESLVVFVYALPIYHGLFYTTQLVYFIKEKSSRTFLGLVLLLMTILMILNAIHHLGNEALQLYSDIIFIPAAFLIVPLYHRFVFFHIRTDNQKARINWLFFFSPSLVFFLFSLYNLVQFHTVELNPLFHSLISPRKLQTFMWNVEAVVYFSLIFVLLVGQYIFACYKDLSCIKSVKLIQSNDSKMIFMNTLWFHAIGVAIVLFISSIVIFFYLPTTQFGTGVTVIFNLIFFAIVGLVGLFGMKIYQFRHLRPSTTLLVDLQNNNSASASINGDSANDSALKNKTSVLISTEETNLIVKNLYSVLENEKEYLNPAFSFSDLATKLDISQYKLTYVLNKIIGKNFYIFINEYRVKQAIIELENNTNIHTIDAIAEKVGFRSKSSFYSAFKKFTGRLPRDFIKKNT